MDRILIDVLEPGRLPCYNFVGEGLYYEWMSISTWSYDLENLDQNFQGSWVPRRKSPNYNVINTEIEETLTQFLDAFPERLNRLRLWYLSASFPENELPIIEAHKEVPGYPEGPGTLVLSLRVCYPSDSEFGVRHQGERIVPNRHGVHILGGMAYIPDVDLGIPFGEFSPAYWIEQVCLHVAGRDSDPNVPVSEFVGERNFAYNWSGGIRDPRVIERSKDLLLSYLDESQRKDLENWGWFQLCGLDGNTYRIVDRNIHNVFLMEGEKISARYCIITQGLVPVYDQMLVQKLLLESNPSHFHEIANKFPGEE